MLATAAVESKPFRVMPFGGLLIGAASTLVVGFLFLLLGGGLGLLAWDSVISFRWSELFPWTAVGLVALAIVSYFVGAYAAARLAGPESRRQSYWYGFSTWALATAAFLAVSAPTVFTAVSATGAGSQPALAALVDTLESVRPRIVSDLQVLKGKVVTTVDLHRPTKGITERAEEEAKRAAKKAKTEEMARAAAAVQLTLFVSLVLGALAAVFGARLAGPSSETPPARAATPPQFVTESQAALL